MRVAALNGVSIANDIQIQSSFEKLGFKIVCDNHNSIGSPQVSLKFVSKYGTKTIIERMGLETLLQLSTPAEGFYIVKNYVDNAANKQILQGVVNLGVNGAIDLGSDGYFSLDVYKDPTKPDLTSVEVYTIDHPVLTKQVFSYDPVVIPAGGVRRDISLTGVTALGIPVQVAESVEFEYPSRSINISAEELLFMRISSNDIVAQDDNGAIMLSNADWIRYVYFDVEVCNRMSLQPYSHINSNTMLYLIREVTL